MQQFKIDGNMLTQRMKEPYEVKLAKAQNLIKKFYYENNGNVAMSVSGGKDSTVMYHMIRQLFDDVKCVSVLGLENIHNIRFSLDYYTNLVVLKPTYSFGKTLEKTGYPIVGKKQARQIDQYIRLPEDSKTGQLLRTGITSKGYKTTTYKLSKDNIEIAEKMKKLGIKVGSDCCILSKEKPLNNYVKENNNCGMFIGIKVIDSMNRKQKYQRETCFNHKQNQCYPIATFTEEDIERYIEENNVELSKAYTEYNSIRTGCCICLMGISNDKDRFLRLKEMDRPRYNYAMQLGYKEILDALNIPY